MRSWIYGLRVARVRPQVLADEQREVDEVPAGYIGAAVGLKLTRTGDTLCMAGDPRACVLDGLTIPRSVFTAAVEVDSMADEKRLQGALAIMLREDPSLQLSEDKETGQWLLSGMGELHLEVAVDRLKREHNLEVRLGRMRVAYRESVGTEAHHVYQYEGNIRGKVQVATIGLIVRPHLDPDQNVFVQQGQKLKARLLQEDGSASEELVLLPEPAREAIEQVRYSNMSCEGKGRLPKEQPVHFAFVLLSKLANWRALLRMRVSRLVPACVTEHRHRLRQRRSVRIQHHRSCCGV